MKKLFVFALAFIAFTHFSFSENKEAKGKNVYVKARIQDVSTLPVNQ
jgi:hypothetical protein